MAAYHAPFDRLDRLLVDMEHDTGDESYALIAKLSGNQQLPEGARVVTRFADIATLRVKRNDIRALSSSEAVAAIEAVRSLQTSETALAFPDELIESDYSRRPAGLEATGKNTVVAVLDWGCDMAFPAFSSEVHDSESGEKKLESRFLAVWDQRSSADASKNNRFGYGRIFRREEINSAINTDDAYAALAYHPGDSDSKHPKTGEWQGAHGTHVLDIAAGNGNGGGMAGVAPEADLIFVHLAKTARVIGPDNLGDSSTVLEALDFVFSEAGDRPCVVNMSVGAHGGPHDASTLVEQGIDRAVELVPGRCVVNSAGNYFAKKAHASGRISTGEMSELKFDVPGDDPTPSELELWHSPVDKFSIQLSGPEQQPLLSIKPDESKEIQHEDKRIGLASYQKRINGDYSFDVVLSPLAPQGQWTLSVQAEQAGDGRYHAWIERDHGLQPRFSGESVDQTFTTGTICNGRNSITVGAIDPHAAGTKLGSFSSSGPTRDGRVKPEVLAPGVSIVAARSANPDDQPEAAYTSKSGTSMAAPHVAGCVALINETLGRPIEIADMRALLFSSLNRTSSGTVVSPTELHRLGHGALNLLNAEATAKSWRSQNFTAPDASAENPTRIFQEDVQMENNDVVEIEAQPDVAIIPAGVPLVESSLSEDADDAYAQDDAFGGEPWPWEQDVGEDTEDDAGDNIEEIVTGSNEVENFESALDGLVTASPNIETADFAAGLAQLRQISGATSFAPLLRSRESVDFPIEPGDLLLRTAASEGIRHYSILVSDAPESIEAIHQRGIPVAYSGPGSYVEVVEPGYGDGTATRIGRKLTDTHGRVARGSEVYRLQAARTDNVSDAVADSAMPMATPLIATLSRWCMLRTRIATIATREERRWTRPNGTKFVESNRAMLPALIDYWRSVPGYQTRPQAAAQRSAANHPEYPWSAAFICYVMRQAGVTAADGFNFSGRHMNYIVGALRNRERSDQNRPFWLQDSIEIQNETTLAAGDLVCLNRRVQNRRTGNWAMTRHSYESLRRRFWSGGNQNRRIWGNSHTSLVVGTTVINGQKFARTIGGNERNSVREQRIPMTEGGGIANPAMANIFGLIKLIRC